MFRRSVRKEVRLASGFEVTKKVARSSPRTPASSSLRLTERRRIFLAAGGNRFSGLGPHDRQSATLLRHTFRNDSVTKIYEQAPKSISFTVTVNPGKASNGVLAVSVVTVCDEGVHDAVPPLSGTKAFARMLYGTLPASGAE